MEIRHFGQTWTAYILPPTERVWDTFLIMIPTGHARGPRYHSA